MQRNDIRSTIIVMISLAFATLTGFMRQIVVAYTLGAGRIADIFLIAFAVPEFVFVALPIILTPVIIPLFSQIRQKHGEGVAWLWGGKLSGWLLLLLLGTTILAGLSAPIFIPWLSPGFNAGERAQTIQVFYRMLPGLLLMGISAMVGSLLQVYRKFARPVLTTAVYNLVFMAALIFLPLGDPLMRAGWGVTLGAAAAMIFQIPLLWRIRPKKILTANGSVIDQETMGKALRLTGWMAAGYGANQMIQFFDRALATSLGAGSAAVLNYGYHLALSVEQLSGLAVSTVMFPGLSEKVEAQELDEARRSINHAMGWVWGLALPASLGFVLLRTPIVQVLLEHGAFQSEATQAVSTVMAIYAFAVLADALCQPLWRAIYAQQNGKVVLGVNSIQTMVRVTADLLLIHQFGYNGLAFSALIGLSLQVILLILFVGRSLAWKISRQSLIVCVKIIIAGSGAYIVTLAVKTWLGNSIPNFPPIYILLISGVILLTIYAALVMGVFNLFRRTEETTRGKQQINLLK
jgi:putative peptidoglycan lipid II flippase